MQGYIFETAHRTSCSEVFRVNLCLVLIPNNNEKVDSQSQVDGKRSRIRMTGSAIILYAFSILTQNVHKFSAE